MYENNFEPPESGLPIENDPRAAYEQFRIRHACLAELKVQSGALALTVIVSILLLYLLQTIGVEVLLLLYDVTPLGLLSLNTLNELYIMVLYLVAFLLPFLAYAQSMRYHLREIPRETPHLPVLAACTGVSLGLSVAGMFLSSLVAGFFMQFGLYPMDIPMDFPPEPVAMVLMVINTAVVPALVEEITHRGIILGSLRRYGDRFAIVISAVIFALMHRNMTQLPNALLLGLALGYFVVKTNSIWTGIFIHFTNNFMALLITAVTLNMNDMQMIVSEMVMLGGYLLFAAGGLIYFFGIRRLDMGLFPSCAPVRERTLYRKYFVNFPMVMMLLLFSWIIYLNFSRV